MAARSERPLLRRHRHHSHIAIAIIVQHRPCNHHHVTIETSSHSPASFTITKMHKFSQVHLSHFSFKSVLSTSLLALRMRELEVQSTVFNLSISVHFYISYSFTRWLEVMRRMLPQYGPQFVSYPVIGWGSLAANLVSER